MTKEEFLSIVTKELEELKKELARAEQDYKISNTIVEKSNNPDLNAQEAKNADEAIRRIKVIKSKIAVLEKIVGIPAYIRIQAATDSEIEDYRQHKLSKLTEEIELENKTLEGLKKDLEENKKKYKDLRNTIASEDLINDEITERLGAISTEEIKIKEKISICENRIKALTKEKEKLSKKECNEIRQDLCSRLANKESITIEINNYDKKKITPLTELFAALAISFEDKKKAEKILEILDEYRNQINKVNRETCYIDTRGFPYFITDYVGEANYEARLWNLDEADERIAYVKNHYNDDEKIIREHFTREKLQGLATVDYDSPDVDFDFLNLHKDKFSDEELNKLRMLVQERNKMGIFTSKDKKHSKEIEIRVLKEKIYSKIKAWYANLSDTVYTDNTVYTDKTGHISFIFISTIRLFKQETFEDEMKKIEDKLYYNKTKIDEFKEYLTQQRKTLMSKQAPYKQKKQELILELRKLAPDFKTEEDLVKYFDKFLGNGFIGPKDIVSAITSAPAKVERHKVIESANKSASDVPFLDVALQVEEETSAKKL